MTSIVQYRLKKGRQPRKSGDEIGLAQRFSVEKRSVHPLSQAQGGFSVCCVLCSGLCRSVRVLTEIAEGANVWPL